MSKNNEEQFEKNEKFFREAVKNVCLAYVIKETWWQGLGEDKQKELAGACEVWCKAFFDNYELEIPEG